MNHNSSCKHQRNNQVKTYLYMSQHPIPRSLPLCLCVSVSFQENQLHETISPFVYDLDNESLEVECLRSTAR